ncbi:MAG TPA: PAS domain-containing protein [Porticoccus sp.]|nr:PAS domain-containing protein [Porticoccus sp.]
MNIELIVKNRFGITHDVLACLAQQHLDLAAVEVESEHIYIDVPALDHNSFANVASALLALEGVQQIRPIDLLPKERRQLHLNALLSTLPDPVFAINSAGLILSANTAATQPLALQESDLVGQPIAHYLGGNQDYLNSPDPQNHRNREVSLAGQTYRIEYKPIQAPSSGERLSSHAADKILILQATNRLGHQMSQVHIRGGEGFNAIVGHAPALARIKERAQRFAAIQAPLLIQGETGTGKELFARAIHDASPWHAAAFLALNCASLPENLVESELFGYDPGAFTGASRGGKPGLFELADGGTAFLDEIGEMSPYVQAKLLRFIQDGTYRRVGGKEERKVNVRIVCATHQDLEALVKQSRFREDLMYRLNVLNLQLPSLRERKEDIAQLAQLFVQQAATQIGCDVPVLENEALSILQTQNWPGNVRQLENLLFRTVALCQEGTIDKNALNNAGITANNPQAQAEPETWKTAQAQFEKELLQRLYQHHPSSRKLAKRLGVSHTTIADKLRMYNIRTKT